MKSVIILSVLLISAFAATTKIEEQLIRDLFGQWKLNHDKVYSCEHEEEARFKIFVENYLNIVELNAIQDDVVLGLNFFADLTNKEFRAMNNGLRTHSHKNEEVPVTKFDVSDLPSSVDWRTKGAVTPVKNQQQCGSCWAFSAVGALEGLHFINTSKLVSFSEQNIVDCDTQSSGCNGGWMIWAFEYTAQAGGIDTEANYPYTAQNGHCHFNKSESYEVNTGYGNVTIQSTDQLKAAIVNQPISVGIDAGGLFFQFYTHGVIKRFCGDSIDHGVLAVGYETVDGTEAFIVKNSWGTSWGDQGYVYISTNQAANQGNGVCGILSVPSFPVNA